VSSGARSRILATLGGLVIGDSPKQGTSRLRIVAWFFGSIAVIWALGAAYSWWTDPLRPVRSAITFEYNDVIQQTAPGGTGYVHVLNTSYSLKLKPAEVEEALKGHLSEPKWNWRGSVVMRNKPWRMNPHFSDRIYIYETSMGTEIKFEREISAAQYHMRRLVNQE
jgi:hypothetical protein